MEKGMSQLNIAVFASGEGTNAENIIRYFQGAPYGGGVALVVTNRADAGVIARAGRYGVPVKVVTKEEINDPDVMVPLLDSYGIGAVVLAGFLLMVPAYLIDRYRERMVNIHPSLLPAYGGKGMYGRRVHEAVVAAGERRTGITIHLVSDRYDEGRILFQASVEVEPCDTVADVDRKVRALEMRHFPRVLHRILFGGRIVTERLLLRPWHVEDAPALYRYASDPAVGPIAGWPPHESVEQSRAVIHDVFSAPETYAVVPVETGEPAGCCGLLFGENRNSARMGDNEAEAGYWIGTPYWGKGLIPEAVEALLKHAFGSLALSAVWISCDVANGRSRRVAEKCGFTYSHTELQPHPLTGTERENVFYRLTCADFAAALQEG